MATAMIMKPGKNHKGILLLGIFLVVICLAVISAQALLRTKDVKIKRNVILITIDALRMDHMSCYGYRLNTTPNIEQLAKKGALFYQAITQGTKTQLAMPSIHTSTYPRTHGVYNQGYVFNPLLKSLAEILKEGRYKTAAIEYSTGYVPALKKGFDFIFDIPYATNKADMITGKAVAWLRNNRQHSFFLWLHYFDPHAPYRPPKPYNRIFMDNSLLNRRHVRMGTSNVDALNAIPLYAAEGDITDVDYYISQYDGEIGFTDEQIGALLKELKDLGLEDKTIVVITADHGELLGERNTYFVHGTLYEENIKVPLIIKCKGAIPAPRQITQQVQSIDIVPTILDLLHMPRPSQMQGRSLMPLILGKGNSPSKYAFTELAREKGAFIGECVRTDQWKLIRSRKGDQEIIYELYNLKLDPHELNNVAEKENKIFLILKDKLSQWEKKTPSFQLKTYPLEAAMKELISSLGYAQ